MTTAKEWTLTFVNPDTYSEDYDYDNPDNHVTLTRGPIEEVCELFVNHSCRNARPNWELVYLLDSDDERVVIKGCGPGYCLVAFDPGIGRGQWHMHHMQEKWIRRGKPVIDLETVEQTVNKIEIALHRAGGFPIAVLD
jgi:hypothetical protein